MMDWLKTIWNSFTGLLAIPSLLLRLRAIWFGATEITVTKCKETYEAIMALFPGTKK